jgi:hypothetical protein
MALTSKLQHLRFLRRQRSGCVSERPAGHGNFVPQFGKFTLCDAVLHIQSLFVLEQVQEQERRQLSGINVLLPAR